MNVTSRGSRGLVAGGVVLCALAVVSIVGAVRQWSTSAEERSLQQRGVTIAATLVQAAYDPSGGDPDGWTTDTVRFSAFGHVEQVVVGHHGDAGPERSSGALSVVFDPEHPAVAVSLTEVDAATPSLDFESRWYSSSSSAWPR